MTNSEWSAICAHVTEEMQKSVSPFVTPISMSEEPGSGVAWGTGTYISGASNNWIITACHVVEDVPPTGCMAHLPSKGGNYIKCGAAQEVKKYPIDAAIVNITKSEDGENYPKNIIPRGRVANFFAPVTDEILFLSGFPGFFANRSEAATPERQKITRFGELTLTNHSFCTQIFRDSTISHEAFDSDFHVAIHYPEKAIKSTDQSLVYLPHPKGLSGSLLWDTKRVKMLHEDRDWNSNMAEVCGIVWGFIENLDIIFVTKIEKIIDSISEPKP